MKEEHRPEYLYKILSSRAWKLSQMLKKVVLPPEDDAFIHFSMEDQLERILTKYWSDVSELAILKIRAAELESDLVSSLQSSS